MQVKSQRQAFTVALLYVLVAGAWVLFSDELVKCFIHDPDTRTTISIYKGWAFVLLTGGLLYVTVRDMLRQWALAVEQRIQAQAAAQTALENKLLNEEQLRLVTQATGDGLWDWNLQTGIADLSSRYWEITGYASGEVVPDLAFFKRLVHPEDWPGVEEMIRAHLEQGERYAVKFRLRHKDGSYRWVFSRGDSMRDAAGRPIRMIGTITDITERQLGEEKLRESEQRYRKLFEMDADAILLADCETHLILDANLSAQRLYGYSHEELLRLKLEDISAEPEISRAAVDRHDVHVPLRWHRKKSGEPFAAEITTSVVESRGQRLKLAAIRDITARIQAKTALLASERKFSIAFNASPVAMSLSTIEEGRYLDVNAAFLKMVQRNRAEVIGHTAFELGVWLEIEQRAAIIATLKELGAVRNLELTIRGRAGQLTHILWSAEAVVIDDQACLLGSGLDITERRQVEEKVRESEQRYGQLFELESDALLLVDCATHRLVDVNQSALKLYGYSRDEMFQLTAEQLSAEPDKTHAIAGAGNLFVPLRWHRKKNGERFAVEIATSIIHFQGRRVELAAVRDITARQQVMDMLGETTEQLLESQKIAGLGSYRFDFTTGIWTGSEVLDELFGWEDSASPRDEAGWLGMVHPQDRAEMQRYLQEEVLQRQQPFDRNYRIVRLKDQQERWVHGLGKLTLDEHGRVVQMVGVIQDITERKRAEAQMSLQFSALTAAANGIVITDHRGKIEWVNPSFTQLTGYSAAEAIGQSPRVLKSGQHPPAFYATMWATVSTGNVWHGELINKRKDGRLYTEDMTITPVRGADGQIAHFVAIKQDVTERRQLENRLQQAQKMEAVGTLAGGIAHDFNNILAAMFGFACLLQQDTEGNAPAQESIAEILIAANRAKDLVQQILTFSRKREQARQVIRLDMVVKEAMKFLRASLPADIQIETHIAAAAPAVLADPTQIYQVAVNLATNALHAMEGRPGRLTVSLEEFTPDEAFIQAHRELKPISYARLTVTDTGHGMDAKTMERIFEPFFTTKPVGKGTGLGLAVVHGIVQSHDGSLTVESQLGEGTTFRLYFPAQMPNEIPTDSPTSSLPCGHGEMVLLVDDEAALTKVFQAMLKRLNYQVIVSNQPRAAVALFRENPAQFALVITDLTMPEMNGLEVTRQLRAIRPDVPVILVSGFSSALTPENLREAGVRELLEKPVSITALAEVVQRALANVAS